MPPLRRYPVALGLLAALIVLIPAGLWAFDALTPPTWVDNRG
ncbi:hypothetical protein [Tenggerimyces flavus]|uniref:Uncharacterized protein n=1 Tax=Tenggerimyces flavus TaxID=1708749 RepID=A0ABV7YA33_9ACTN|nr:hypothetical protein [Tenggerimyces flavus]MBM7783504.1 hypothetical protein [Tenggerimyces flavus]